MNWADNGWLILIAIAVIVLVIWLLMRGSKTAADVAPPVATPAEPKLVPATEVPSVVAIAPLVGLMPVIPAPPVPDPVPAPEPMVSPAPATAADPDKPNIAAPVGDPNDLNLIKGVGPKLNALLIGLGVRRFDQIAAWTANDIAEVDAHLGTFRGRIARDNWVDQASLLATGDKAGFEAKYGALGSEIR